MKKWLTAGSVVLILLLSYFLFKNPEAEDNIPSTQSEQRPALSVNVDYARQTQLPIQIKAYGSIVPWHEMVVSSETMDLRLMEVAVDIGDQVKKGQVLAAFDIQSVKADVEQMRASLEEAEAIYTEAQENKERMQALKNSSALSEKSIAEYIRAEKAAQARVAVARAALDTQKIRLQNAMVVAPDDGIISSRSATLGTVTGTGGELFRIVRKNRLEWHAELMPDELNKIKPGTLVELQLTDGEHIQGVSRVVAPTVNNQSRIGLVYVDLAESPAVRAGMFMQGIFKLGENQALVVPSQSVVTRDSFNYVFVLGEDKYVRQVKITTGRRVNNWVEVLNGIDANDKVVTAGAGFLNDGDLVHVLESESTSATDEIYH